MALHPDPNDLTTWEKYFLNRIAELRPICGTPWGFACACILLEVLGKLVAGAGRKDFGRIEYVKFVEKWLPDYGPKAAEPFVYKKPFYRTIKTSAGKKKKLKQEKSLAMQMYCILRCGLVHNYSFVAGKKERKFGARDRSIWMLGRAEAKKLGVKHLDNFSRRTPEPIVKDAAIFVAEDFLDDIEKAIRDIFKTAKVDAKLERKMVRHLTERRPIGE